MSKQTANLKTRQKFGELVNILKILRGPKGCPWDKRQTHKSLLPYLFEEARELRCALNKKDWDNFCEELGDVLLQVVFHAQVASETGRFDINDVIKNINDKLLRRHPHVFGGKALKTPEEVTRLWEQIKKQEKTNQK
jgi:tetrapyrrole methylase family protein/MazG family protein